MTLPPNRDEQGALRSALIYFSMMAVGFPTGVFVHECGHFAAAKAFGWTTTFKAAFVGWTHSPPPSDSSVMVFLLAGVIFDVIFVGIGLLLLTKCTRTRSRQFDIALLTGTLLTAFSIRWCISPIFVMLNSSDEAMMSSLLGFNRWVIPICTLPVGVGIAGYAIYSHIRNQTVVAMMAGGFGAFCGLGLWINIVGPMLFGK